MKFNKNRTIQLLEETFCVKLNLNYNRELSRLIFEVCLRDNCPANSIIEQLSNILYESKATGKDKILQIKKELIKLRFPKTSMHKKINNNEVYLSKLEDKEQNIYHPQLPFIPKGIFVENDVKGCELEINFRNAFPDIEIKYLNKYSNVLDEYKPTVNSFKEPYVFIVKEHQDFLKPCPCTKRHIGCGYWILNIGFGCPFDCSYCYLQQYQNMPGIILPANLDSFLNEFDDFHRKINNKMIRIGTGEFCDSLALDHLSGYSKKLVPFFSKRNVLFELKTKSANIANLLAMPASKNIVIAWSLNPQSFIDNEEIGVASLKERLEAAAKIQKHGYSIAFHFDPIVPFNGWENKYADVIKLIYEHVEPSIAWISLGTLRFTRELKGYIEQRFNKSNIIYGEMLMGDDKKLRYPEFMRIPVYKHMVECIRNEDKNSPVYLCMESKEAWGTSISNVSNAKEVEEILCRGSK